MEGIVDVLIIGGLFLGLGVAISLLPKPEKPYIHHPWSNSSQQQERNHAERLHPSTHYHSSTCITRAGIINNDTPLEE